MTTRRIQPLRNADGSTMNFQQRRQMRLRHEREQRIEQRQQKAQEQIDAALNPPPAPLPFRERQAQRKAEAEGRAQAQFEAEQAAAANAGPINPYRQRAEALSNQLYQGRVMQARFAHFSALADKWDREQAAAAEAAAKQAAIDGDASVINARESAGYLVKMAEQTGQPELVKMAQEAAGIAQAADVAMYWQRAASIEASILQFNDARAAERRTAKAEADAAYEAATTAAQESKARLDAAISAGEVVETAAPEAATV